MNNVQTVFSFLGFSEQEKIPKEVDYIFRAAVSAGIIGWAYGGIPAFIYAKKRYIEQSQGEMYHNRFDAVVSIEVLIGKRQFYYSLYASDLLGMSG